MRPQSACIDSGVRGGGCYGKQQGGAVHLEGSRQSIQPAENSMSHARHSSCVRCGLERQQSIEGGNCLLPRTRSHHRVRGSDSRLPGGQSLLDSFHRAYQTMTFGQNLSGLVHEESNSHKIAFWSRWKWKQTSISWSKVG